jgi:hypothetical protein
MNVRKGIVTALTFSMLSVPVIRAEVDITFINSLPNGTVGGDLTLDFTVDSVGNVALDASTTSTNADVVFAVNQWDGAVGFITYAGAFSSSFTIDITATHPLRLTSWGGGGGGLGVQGLNQNRLDRPGIEEIYATPSFSISGVALDIEEVEWSDRTIGPPIATMQLDYADQTILNELVNVPGMWDLVGSNVFVNAGDSLTFGNDNSNTNLGSGYVLYGFSFDLRDEVPVPGVEVLFTNSLPVNSAATNNPGTITLDFSVDGSGNVTLDASTASAISNTVAAVDAWDGPVGYIDYAGLFNTNFTIEIGAGNSTRLSEWGGAGGGIGYGGQNSWRIDRPGLEAIVANADVPGASIVMRSVRWTSRANTTVDMMLTGPKGSYTNALPSLDGDWNLSAENLYLNTGDSLTFGNASNTTDYILGDGYTLQGIGFVVVEEITEPGVDVTFPHAGSNFGDNQQLVLDFEIGTNGIISLDASTTSTNSTAIDAVNGWDSDDVGYITNTALFGKTFSLTAAAANENSATAPITIWHNDGGLVAVQGQNSGRIDGAGLATQNLERLTWTLSGDVTLDFTGFSYANAHPANGVVQLSDWDTEVLYGPYGVSAGKQIIASDGFSIGAGQGLVFAAVTNTTDGLGLGGVSFDISESQALIYINWAAAYGLIGGMTDDDDLDGLDNLYEFAVGGNPTNGSVAPAYMPTGSLIESSGSNVLQYVYTRRQPVPVDMQYYCEVSSQGLILPNWADAGYTVTGEADADPGFRTVTNQTAVVEDLKFIKLTVEQN